MASRRIRVSTYLTPSEFAPRQAHTQRPVMQRARALRDFAPWPVAPTAPRGPHASKVTCFPVSGPIIAGKFEFSGCVIRAAGRGMTMKRSKCTEAQIGFILRQAEENGKLKKIVA